MKAAALTVAGMVGPGLAAVSTVARKEAPRNRRATILRHDNTVRQESLVMMVRDEKLYAQAMNEWGKGWTDPDLLIKAEVMASGNMDALKFEYVKLRVEQIKSENIKELPLTIASGALASIRSMKQAQEHRAAAKLAAAEERAAEQKAAEEQRAGEKEAAREKRLVEKREFDEEYLAVTRKIAKNNEQTRKERLERSTSYQKQSARKNYALSCLGVLGTIAFLLALGSFLN